ncbi:hypothetical protein MATL_G00175590 [Megalops atlanticus]|uniref:Mastermind-like 1/3 transactivation domain-containing protein n=1 Tax=Megalops atlanticus TaxID=7932 RepID=A0A9D3PPK8_MEGAT|nr:hypothetical protein MATL_G00175590 [Megalops atlanticus]
MQSQSQLMQAQSQSQLMQTQSQSQLMQTQSQSQLMQTQSQSQLMQTQSQSQLMQKQSQSQLMQTQSQSQLMQTQSQSQLMQTQSQSQLMQTQSQSQLMQTQSQSQLMQTQSQLMQSQSQLMQTQSQLMQTQAQIQKQQQQPQVAKFPTPNTQSSWSQATPSQSPLGGGYSLEKPSSPALYQQDFPNAKQLMMPTPPNKGSPKAGAGSYLQGAGHSNMLSHAPPNALSQNAASGQSGLLDYANTKPLSHYNGTQGPRGPPPPQNKAALLTLIRQQPMKQKAGPPFRPHQPHPQLQQEQNAYPGGPHIPGPSAAMATQQPGNAMAGNHGNAAYLSGQAAALKQQQMQFLLGQRQHMMAEQEKQRQQQEQQLKRHLTRPPPQYQDQQNSQNPFQQPQQPQVNQFTGSSPSLATVGLSCGPATGGQRMFPQTQGMMGMGVGQGGGPASAPPPAVSQAEMASYSSMPLLPAGQPRHQAGGAVPAAYRQNQNLLTQQQQQQHKAQPSPALLNPQQQLARMPSAMAGTMPGSMPLQGQAWQQQAMGALGLLGTGACRPSVTPPSTDSPASPSCLAPPPSPRQAGPSMP